VAAPSVGESFADLERQDEALTFGMWVFLASELLLFAALFTLYAAYRVMYPAGFAAAIAHNTFAFGTANMYVLLTSSLLAALAVSAGRAGQPRRCARLLAGTALLGLVFLGIKGWEYARHIHEGSLPGPYYHFGDVPGPGGNRFFLLYWVMTGFHAAHVAAGVSVVAFMAVRARAGRYRRDRLVRLEMGTLYWHLVDLVWIFLWPLFYLG
jgi:cytochrome c oxidase subunit 3